MDEMQEKTPRLKTTIRPNFSELGRWIWRSVEMGRMMIQMSVMMLMALVPGVC